MFCGKQSEQRSYTRFNVGGLNGNDGTDDRFLSSGYVPGHFPGFCNLAAWQAGYAVLYPAGSHRALNLQVDISTALAVHRFTQTGKQTVGIRLFLP